MGSTGASRISGGVTSVGTNLSKAQQEVIRQTIDYNAELIEDFGRDFASVFDDRAYQDEFYDLDEYEDAMEDVIRRAERAVNELRAEADRRSFSYWSQEYANENLLAAARLEEILDDYKREYRYQRMSGRYRRG